MLPDLVLGKEPTQSIIIRSIRSLCDKVDEKDKNIDELSKLNERNNKIDALIKTMEGKDQKILKLEYRVNELELSTNEAKRYRLKNNVIIRGLSVPKDTSYASVTAATRETDVSVSHEEVSSKSSAAEVFKNTRIAVCKFIRDNLNVEIQGR